jgi:hypothetical protein
MSGDVLQAFLEALVSIQASIDHVALAVAFLAVVTLVKRR